MSPPHLRPRRSVPPHPTSKPNPGTTPSPFVRSLSCVMHLFGSVSKIAVEVGPRDSKLPRSAVAERSWGTTCTRRTRHLRDCTVFPDSAPTCASAQAREPRQIFVVAARWSCQPQRFSSEGTFVEIGPVFFFMLTLLAVVSMAMESLRPV